MKKYEKWESKNSILCISLDTTGLNFYSDKIIQIGLILLKKGEIVEKRNFLVNPGEKYDIENISEFTLKATKLSKEKIKLFPNQKEVYLEIKSIFKKHNINNENKSYFLGFNVNFHLRFLNKFFEQFNDSLTNYVNNRRFDPLIIMPFVEKFENIELKSYKFDYLCDVFKIPKDFEDAMGKIEGIIDILDIIEDRYFINPTKRL